MTYTLVIIKDPPYEGRKSHEILEAVMGLALFDVEHRVVFFEAGLAWLTEPQTPPRQKSLAKQLAALPMYGSDAIYYCQEHAPLSTPMNSIAEPLSTRELADWVRKAAKVEVF